MSCSWLKPLEASIGYDLDTSKIEQIFHLLLREKQLVLPNRHQIPPSSELRGHRYYKWHDADTHNTTDCKALRQQIQLAIKQARLIYSRTPMKVDKTSFLVVNMVNVASTSCRQGSPVITTTSPQFISHVRSAVEARNVLTRRQPSFSPAFDVTINMVDIALASKGKGKDDPADDRPLGFNLEEHTSAKQVARNRRSCPNSGK